jgi:hypothetical protein
MMRRVGGIEETLGGLVGIVVWRSASGGIALSAVATTAQAGSVFQAAAAARSSKIAAKGRWLTARIRVTSSGRSAANASR